MDTFDGIGLTRVCLEKAIDEIDRAISAPAQSGIQARSEALTRAASGIAALGRGVSSDNPMHAPLTHLYGAAETAVRSSIKEFRPATLERVQEDLRDILEIVL